MKNAETPRKFHFLTTDGQQGVIHIPMDGNAENSVGEALAKAGVGAAERKNVLLSETPFASFAEVAAPETRVLTTEDMVAASGLPPIPQPTNPDSALPEKSEVMVVATKPAPPLFVTFGDGRVPISTFQQPPFSVSPAFPTGNQIQYKRYWVRLAMQVLTGPQTYEHGIQSTQGMSVTDEKKISASIGIAVKGLSASLTATFSHSVTVSQQETVTNNYTVPVPAGKTCNWALWQLIDEFVILDSDGAPLVWNGKAKMGGIASFSISFPECDTQQNTTTYASNPVMFAS